MSWGLWAEIERRLDRHVYMSGLDRTQARIDQTAEVFTPSALVVQMLRKIPKESYAPGRTVLDPACGDGQFLIAAKWAKVLVHNMSESEALAEIYGIDIMRDNVDLCKRRLGGGTIVMGDALNPQVTLEGQTVEEREIMRTIFGADAAPEQLFALAS